MVSNNNVHFLSNAYKRCMKKNRRRNPQIMPYSIVFAYKKERIADVEINVSLRYRNIMIGFRIRH